MRFERVRVTRFGPLTDLDTGDDAPLPGMVVVHGPNEAGKSAFHRLLTSILFGFYPAHRDQNPHTPWTGGDIEASAKIRSVHGETGEVHRRLLSAPRGTFDSEGRVEALANRAIPWATHVDRRVYAEVFAITQAELSGVASVAWASVRDQLVVGMGSPGLRSPRELAQDLGREADRLWRPDRRGRPRHVEILEEREDLATRQVAARDRNRELRDLLRRLEEVESELAEWTDRIQATSERLSRFRALLPLRERLLRLEELEARAGDPAELTAIPPNPSARLAELGALAEAEAQARRRLDALGIELRRNLDRLEGGPGPAPPTLPYAGVVSAGVALGLLAWGSVERSLAFLGAGIGLLLLAGSLLVRHAASRSHHRELALAREEEIRRLRSALSEEEARRGESEADSGSRSLDALLAALAVAGGGPDAAGLRHVEARLHAFEQSLRVREELERERGPIPALATEIEAAEEEGGDRIELPRRSKLLEAEVAALNEEARAVREERGRLRERARSLSGEETEDLLEGRKRALDEVLREVARERDRKFVIARILERAEARFRAAHQPELVQRAESYLARITDDRYRTLLVEETGDPGAFRLQAPHLPEPMPVVPPLSTGTREQAYLALRLAIVDHLDREGEPLPLLLDEILMNWDPDRRGRLLDLVEEISHRRQVFVFTCHDPVAEEVANRGGAILRLPAPRRSMGESAAPGPEAGAIGEGDLR